MGVFSANIENCTPEELELRRAYYREAGRRYRQDPDYRERQRQSARAYEERNREKRREQHRAWDAAHPEKLAAKQLRIATRSKGITEQDYHAMLEKQQGRCAICGDEPEVVHLRIDHDHETGAIRGLLCRNCNLGLGNFRDSPAKMIAALEYLALAS